MDNFDVPTTSENESGTKLICSNCGNLLEKGQIFCPKCGHKSEVATVEKSTE